MDDLEDLRKLYQDFMAKNELGTFPKLENGMKENFDVDKSTASYANGGIVEEKAGQTPPIKAPESVNEAMTTKGKGPQALQHIIKAIKESPIQANIKPGYVGATFTKRFAHGGEVKKPNFLTNSSTKNYAGGGEVNGIDQDFLNQLNQGTVPGMEPAAPAVPSLSDTTASIAQTPDTNYDFYKDIGENDRKALYDRLTKQQKGPGSVIAQAAGGIGDAISNSFGGQHTSYMKDIQGRQDSRKTEELNAFDTQRTNRLQGMQGNQEMQMNDPKSPLSMGMQKILRSKGLNVPSGMNANVLLKLAGPLGELAMKEATLAQGANQFDVSSGIRKEEVNRQKHKDEADQKDKDTARTMEGAKGLSARPWYQKATEAILPDSMSSDATKTFRSQLNTSADPQSVATGFSDPDKEAKYQAWKASQGR